MKDAQDALIRVLVYIAVAVALSALSRNISLSNIVALWAFAAAPGETAILIRNIRLNRQLAIENLPTKELPVPDTQPLDRK